MAIQHLKVDANTVTEAKGTADGRTDIRAEELETLASTVTNGAPLVDESKIAVGIAVSTTLTVQPAPSFAAAAAPASDAQGAVVRVAGTVDLGATLEPAGDGTGVAVIAYPGDTFDTNVINAEDRPVPVSLPAYGVTQFGQVRVAQRQTQFDNTQEYGLDTRAWGTSTATGGTVAFNTTTGRTDLVVTSSSGSIADMRTHVHFVYQPGAVTRAIITLAHADSGQANQVREWGFFNNLDGFGWRLSGTTLSIFRRTSTGESPSEQVVTSDTWDDPYAELDLTFGNRYEIALQWLSYGIVEFWVNARRIHTLNLSNSILLPSTRTAQLPLDIRIENTGASSTSSIHYVCGTVYLDGGTELKFVPNSRAITTPKTGIGTTYTPIIGLRMGATINGRINRKIVIPTRTRVSNASGRATVAVILNPSSTTGGTWTQVNAGSGVEYNEGITSYTGGTELSRLFLPNTADTREFDGRDDFSVNGSNLHRDAFDTTGDVMLFVAKADVGTADIDIVARWWELG